MQGEAEAAICIFEIIYEGVQYFIEAATEALAYQAVEYYMD